MALLLLFFSFSSYQFELWRINNIFILQDEQIFLPTSDLIILWTTKMNSTIPLIWIHWCYIQPVCINQYACKQNKMMHIICDLVLLFHGWSSNCWLVRIHILTSMKSYLFNKLLMNLTKYENLKHHHSEPIQSQVVFFIPRKWTRLSCLLKHVNVWDANCIVRAKKTTTTKFGIATWHIQVNRAIAWFNFLYIIYIPFLT